jgi:putative addiction module component (TIGR02574 family)
MSTLILQGIQQLSVAERIQLVEDIWDSIATAPETLGLTDSQQKELDNRLMAYQQDSSAGSSWAEVKVRLQS